METCREKVMVWCYWNGCVKYGPDGVYYEGGSTPRKLTVKRKTPLSRLLDGVYLITGFDKEKSKFEIFGRYPVAVSSDRFTYVHLPVVDDGRLETMLEVPSNHHSINSVELYLEVKSMSDDVINPAARSSSLEKPGSSSKRKRTHQPQEDTNLRHPPVKLEKDNGYEVQGIGNNNEVNADFGNGSTHGGGDTEMRDKNSGSDAVAQVVNLSNNDSDSGVSKPCLSSLWLGDHDLRVGLCFKDSDELKKAVSWFSIKGQQMCVVGETKKDECTFECVRWQCKWSLQAAKMEKHGLFEITKYIGPHTCLPTDPEDLKSDFEADEIERVLRVQPTLTVAELQNWWLEKFGYELETKEMRTAKHEAIKKIYGDWDESFRELPKLMAAFQSSNGLVVDWQYDIFPNPEFVSFHGVFWAFPQSIVGFQHCRPLICVDTKDLNGKYPMKLMIALGLDADNCYFLLAFAVTTEVFVDSWRWFLAGIREKVTQRKGLCLMSSPHPDILAVINERGSLWQEPWAYHRLCLDHLCSQFHNVFQDDYLKSLVEDAGCMSKEEEFDSHMESIKKKNPEARRWLDQFPPQQWALAHDNGRRYGIIGIDMENVLSTFKSLDSLCLPVTATALLLFDELRLYLQKGICKSRGRLNRGDMYTKPVMDRLKEFRTTSITYLVMPVENNAFQVTTPLEKYGWIVHLSECASCTCGEFQEDKYPCPHALAVCEKLKINPLQYVDNCYTVERYYKTYAAKFNPVPEVSAWPEASGVPTLLPPPAPKVPAGKPKDSDTNPKPSLKKKGT